MILELSRPTCVCQHGIAFLGLVNQSEFEHLQVDGGRGEPRVVYPIAKLVARNFDALVKAAKASGGDDQIL
jgi:hypothetical protein